MNTKGGSVESDDKEYLVRGIEEAAYAGYRQGWNDGYNAARLTVELVVDAWRKDPMNFDVESALKALDMSKEKAWEMLSRDKFEARCALPDEPGKKWFG